MSRRWVEMYVAANRGSRCLRIHGFSHTVENKLIRANPRRPILLWVHAMLFFSWVAFYITQSVLVGTRKVKLHRTLGWAGAALGMSMVVLGPGWHVDFIILMMHWDIAGLLTTVFMVAAICYWITRPQALSAGGPASKSKIVRIVVVMTLGLAASLLPLVRTTVPVMGQTQWTGMDILLRGESWKIPPSPVVLDIASTYLLMLVAVVAVFIPHPRRPLLVISLLGVISSSWAQEMGHSLLFDWFIRSGGILRSVNVAYAAGMYAPEIAMSILLLITTDLT